MKLIKGDYFFSDNVLPYKPTQTVLINLFPGTSVRLT